MVAIMNITPFIISPLVGNYVESHNNITNIIVSQIILILISSFIYTAHFIAEYWYLVYIYVFVQAICVCVKISSYQYIIPSIVSKEQIEKANKIQALSQASVYIVSVGLGGVMLNFLGPLSNLVTDNIVYVISIIIIFYFRYLVKNTLENNAKSNEFNENELVEKETITFKNGMIYLKNNPTFLIIIMINSIIYYVYGVIEIVNYTTGFDSYDILILSIVLGLSNTGTIILYFFKADKYILNYAILIISILSYAIIELVQFVPLWLFGLWMFNYIHYAYYIMMTTIIQKDVDPHYKGRLYTYYYGSSSVLYALGSFTGSFLHLWYWLPIGISIIIIGIMIKKFDDIQKLINVSNTFPITDIVIDDAIDVINNNDNNDNNDNNYNNYNNYNDSNLHLLSKTSL